MSKPDLIEIRLKLPSDVAETLSNKEIIGALCDKSFTKAEYYQSKCNEYREKYKTTFASFRKKVNSSKEEHFQEWDDLLIWEGCELAMRDWKKKYAELKKRLA
ncbi:hypothetical protein JW926_07690 [Candidatus Sumerlaeota bacterium]|nr:hypothetical protein [Candidatus Sumerlaeota bacterium]